MITDPSSNVYDSAAQSSPFWEELRALLQYRHLLRTLIHRDFITRYKRSVLGVAWSMLNPLGMMIILSVVFSRVFRQVQGYPAYVLSGIVAWTYFAQTTSAANRNILWGGSLMKRIYMPRAILVVSIAGSNLINLLFSLVPLLVVVLAFGIRPGSSLLVLPLVFSQPRSKESSHSMSSCGRSSRQDPSAKTNTIGRTRSSRLCRTHIPRRSS